MIRLGVLVAIWFLGCTLAGKFDARRQPNSNPRMNLAHTFLRGRDLSRQRFVDASANLSQQRFVSKLQSQTLNLKAVATSDMQTLPSLRTTEARILFVSSFFHFCFTEVFPAQCVVCAMALRVTLIWSPNCFCACSRKFIRASILPFCHFPYTDVFPVSPYYESFHSCTILKAVKVKTISNIGEIVCLFLQVSARSPPLTCT